MYKSIRNANKTVIDLFKGTILKGSKHQVDIDIKIFDACHSFSVFIVFPWNSINCSSHLNKMSMRSSVGYTKFPLDRAAIHELESVSDSCLE